MAGPETTGETGLSQLFAGLAALPSILKLLKDQQQQIAIIQKEITAKPEARGDSDGWLDAKGAASYLGISENTFDRYRYKTNPRIKGYPLDGKTLYKKSDLNVFVKLYGLKSANRA